MALPMFAAVFRIDVLVQLADSTDWRASYPGYLNELDGRAIGFTVRTYGHHGSGVGIPLGENSGQLLVDAGHFCLQWLNEHFRHKYLVLGKPAGD